MIFGKKAQNIVFIFSVAAAYILLVYLRMVPSINNGTEFRFDRAFNYRMTKEAVSPGGIPKIDKLSTYPDGKVLRDFLSTTMYHLAAFFYKTENLVRKIPLNRSILHFSSIFASLIFFPVFFISYDLYRNKWIALLSGFMAGIIPAYLHRSTCYWYRFEIVGTPVLFTSLLFLIKSFGPEDRRKAFLYAFLCALFMGFALNLWRVSVIFLLIYLAIMVYIWLSSDKYPKNFWVIFGTVIGISLIFLIFTPGFAHKNIASEYGGFPKALIQVLLSKIGIKQDFSDFTRLLLYTRELANVSLKKMFFEPTVLSLSGFLLLAFFAIYAYSRKKTIQKNIILSFSAFYLILTFIFLRNKIILAPLVAITIGESIVFAIHRKKIFRNVFLILITALLVKTCADAYMISSTRKQFTSIRPTLKEALNFINHNVPQNAVILSYWSDGYPIQTYCNRPTITDGLFESPEIVKRILALSRIYYSYDEKDLYDFCNNYGATYILVPSNRKTVYAGYAGVNILRYFIRRDPTTLGKNIVLNKLMNEPSTLTYFVPVYKNNEFSLYKVKPRNNPLRGEGQK